MFSAGIAQELHGKRDYHNAVLEDYCNRHQIPLADVCSHLRDEHFADELHPNEAGAKIIATEVFKVLAAIRKES
jgi:lysophospholipase L1-like esterase